MNLKQTTRNMLAYAKAGWGKTTRHSMRSTRKWYASQYRKLRATEAGRVIVRDLYASRYPAATYVA